MLHRGGTGCYDELRNRSPTAGYSLTDVVRGPPAQVSAMSEDSCSPNHRLGSDHGTKADRELTFQVDHPVGANR